ncbi:MAG: heme exporter protein CcmB [Acidimicrobiaceae bacterium]|nr:heme exporter protein CcmB [Acidimicrobiaceae bacterium]
MRTFAGDAGLVAAKDLRIEWRARTTLGQVLPFALLVLVLFGFALDANRPALRLATPGLLWMTVLFVTVVAAQRSVALESADGARRVLLLSGMAPAAAFAGKAAAVAVQLLAVEALVVPGAVLLYGAAIESVPLVAAACVAATVGLSAAGSLLGAVVAGVRAHQTVLPILLLPVSAPVLIAATRAFADGLGTVAVGGWSWVGLLAGFAAVNVAVGAVAYGPLLEDA